MLAGLCNEDPEVGFNREMVWHVEGVELDRLTQDEGEAGNGWSLAWCNIEPAVREELIEDVEPRPRRRRKNKRRLAKPQQMRGLPS